MDTRGWFASVVLYLVSIIIAELPRLPSPPPRRVRRCLLCFIFMVNPVDNIDNVDMPAEYSIHYRQAMAARATPDLLATS